VTHTYSSSYSGGGDPEDGGPDCPDINARPYLKNSQSKKGWRSGSTDRVHASKHKVLSLDPGT
jgi:hypothetical protein